MIPIQNIYYMLSYAFQILNEQGYKNIATEQFHNTAELMAAILEKGIAIQLKRGLGKEYIPQTEALSSLRGKIDIAESIKTQSMLRKQLICTYDEFSVNSIMNRIIKEHSMQVQFNKHTLHSANLYQIFTYVKNKDYELRAKEHTVSGMLLYAKTDEEIYPNNVYQMSGNQITVRTLDLNLPFDEIAGQLNTIAKTHFDL